MKKPSFEYTTEYNAYSLNIDDPAHIHSQIVVQTAKIEGENEVISNLVLSKPADLFTVAKLGKWRIGVPANVMSVSIGELDSDKPLQHTTINPDLAVGEPLIHVRQGIFRNEGIVQRIFGVNIDNA